MDAKKLENILKELGVNRPVFHSEADFQFALAWAIQKENSKYKIRLEQPYVLEDKTIYVDIVVETDKKKYIPIELKYKTANTVEKNKSFKIKNESFYLKYQGAQDISRYDCFKDVSRLEDLMEDKHVNFENGYTVWLTNDHLYWNGSREGVISENFSIQEGGPKINSGKPMRWKGGSEGTKKGREKAIKLKNQYEIEWKPYSDISKECEKNSEFKYAVLYIPREVSI